MQRIGFRLKIREDRVEEYRRAHADVWPEMRQALHETGWHNYSLFLDTDGTLFGYVETPDFEQAKAGMATREVNARWQAIMQPFFEDLSGNPDAAMTPLDTIFHLE
jgi:L-rhamnose mutarotase